MFLTSGESESESCLVVSDSLLLTVYGILQARILEQVAFPFSRDLPNPGIESRSPSLQLDSLPAEPLGKLKNTGMDSLSLLQRIFLTQELNWGLLHCRWIFYQMSQWRKRGFKFVSFLSTGRTILLRSEDPGSVQYCLYGMTLHQSSIPLHPGYWSVKGSGWIKVSFSFQSF